MNKKLKDLFLILCKDMNEPKFDRGKCEDCGYEADLIDFDSDVEGDWENGYYDISICPDCEDGGTVEYGFSKSQLKLWKKWRKLKMEKKI